MTALQITKTRPDPVSIGTKSIALPSTGLDKNSQFIATRLTEIAAPSPTFVADAKLAQSLEEKMYDTLAAFKIWTATVAMHLDREWRVRLFRQFDSLLALDDWQAEDLPPSTGSFATLLRMLILLKPTRSPGLGASADGNLIAAWTTGDDRLTIECLPKDFVRWTLSVTIDGEKERSAAVTPLGRLVRYYSLILLTVGLRMAIAYLPDEHHLVRFVPWARLRKDENEKVVGVLGAAFRLRDDEEYLSATWVEFFNEKSHNDCVASAVRAVRVSKLKVTARSGFAVGNVGRVKRICLNDAKNYKIRIIHEPESDNRAHTALRRWPRDNDDLLELLAEEAWSSIVLNMDIPE